MADYDIVTVGGGAAGSAFAKVMAERGHEVLIVERETQFRDRVRGEFVFPWGVAEAQQLGLYDVLEHAGGHHPTYWANYAGPDALPPRNFAEETPQHLHGLSIYHPRMQQALLRAAEAAGAEVRRGVRVVVVERGRTPSVQLEGDGGASTVSARLVVGADGRSSMMRRWCGFAAHEAATGNIFAGVLLENVPASADSSICMINPFAARMVLYLPQRAGSGRAYLATRSEDAVRLRGNADFGRFLEECVASGLAPALIDGARRAGPLASFDGTESWVEHPYRDGCALIGDAAATSDPTWGQGLSLSFRDARVLRDALLASDNWNAAAHAYAAAHDQYAALVRTTTSWYTRIFLQPGADADELRARVLPQLASDPLLLPDTLVAGPDWAPPTAAHAARIFGEPAAAGSESA